MESYDELASPVIRYGSQQEEPQHLRIKQQTSTMQRLGKDDSFAKLETKVPKVKTKNIPQETEQQEYNT